MAVSQAIYLISTLPPSVNGLYIARGKLRYKTREYSSWIVKTLRELYKRGPIDCKKFGCDVRIPWSMKTRGDIDNRGKAILDIFVKAKIIPDDRHCLDFRIRYMADTRNNCIEVEFTPMEETDCNNQKEKNYDV